MARNQETLDIPRRAGWIEITNADAEVVTFQVLMGEVEIRVGGTVPPVEAERGWIYGRPEGERQIDLANLANGGGTRVWARALGNDAGVLVDHA